MLPRAAGGIGPEQAVPHGGFARASYWAAGNQLPAVTGDTSGYVQDHPGPGRSAGGNTGTPPGTAGADASRPPQPVRVIAAVNAAQQETAYRGGGNTGWLDKLIARDRHAGFKTGAMRTGDGRGNEGSPPNPEADGPARPSLFTINRTVSYQAGTDRSRNQDDLSRPYTWIGEAGSKWTPVYGGVPGLFQPYGTRGGVPYAIVSPVGQGEPGDGPRDVLSGPPHGLHSLTLPDYSQTLGRYASTVQMRPVRQDRPDNSRVAGQSYNQTVQTQPSTRPAGRAAGPAERWPNNLSGWRGAGRGGR